MKRLLAWCLVWTLLSGLAQAAQNPALVDACVRVANTTPKRRTFQWWRLQERADLRCPQGEVASPACLQAVADEKFYRAAMVAAGPLAPRAQALARCEALKEAR